MRYAFIKTLTEEAKRNKNIVLLTGDLGFTVFEDFKEKFPDRFINVGVAEQNMMGLAAGLALSGKIVFAYSIATFATMRPFEQIRDDIASHNTHVVVVGTGGGLSYADASITHHSIEDIGIMRQIPGMTILCPADPLEVMWATKKSIKLKAPIYLRLGKKGEPKLYSNFPKLTLGKGSVLKKGNDLAIIATGNIVYNALKSAEILKKRGINAMVVSMHTIKPIDKNLINDISKKIPAIISVEEHSVIGGLGSAVSEIVSSNYSNTKLLRLGIPDKFVFEIGTQEFLRNKYNLSPQGIAKKAYNFLKMRNG